MASPSPSSTYAIRLALTSRYFSFPYGSAPVMSCVPLHPGSSVEHSHALYADQHSSTNTHRCQVARPPLLRRQLFRLTCVTAFILCRAAYMSITAPGG